MATRTTTISFKDAKGDTSVCEYNTPDSAGMVTTAELAEEIALAIYDLIGGDITGINIITNVDLPGGITPGAGTTADVEEGALFIFRTENNHPSKLRIPTFLETFFLAGTKQVDLADADVDAFVDLMINGRTDIVNGDVEPCDSRGEDIVSLASAKELFLPR